jgi:uncharacterized protein with HEPN domain
MRRDLAYLEDIVEASDAIAEFIRDHDMESFLSSPMLKSALAYQFTVIGEAAARVDGELRERHPLIPWAKAKGMRNSVVHHYFGVAWDEVWRTATQDIPSLRIQITELLRTEFPDSDTTRKS